MWLLLLSALAGAHPSAMRVVAHKTMIQVEPDGIRVVYEAAFPVHSAADERDVASRDELIAGLLVRIDDVTIPLTAADFESTHRKHVIQTRLVVTGPIADADIERIEVSLANYPTQPGYFTWDVLLDRGMTAEGTSLKFTKEGRERIYTSVPLVGDKFRGISVDVQSGGLPEQILAALTPEAPAFRTLKDARPQSLMIALQSAVVTPSLLLLGAVLAGVAGTGAAKRDGVGRTGVAAAFMAWLCWAMVAPGAEHAAQLDVAGGIALICCGGLLAMRRGSPSVFSALAAAFLAATMRAGAAGFAVWGCWAIGRAFAGEAPEEEVEAPVNFVGPIAAIVGLLLLSRGAGALWT